MRWMANGRRLQERPPQKEECKVGPEIIARRDERRRQSRAYEQARERRNMNGSRLNRLGLKVFRHQRII